MDKVERNGLHRFGEKTVVINYRRRVTNLCLTVVF
jgi:hypothetical protein